MRLIIAGSRSITSRETVEDAIDESPFSVDDIDVLVNGGANGVDSVAVDIVESSEHEIVVESYLAEDFMEEAPHPKVAPLLRNEEMAKNADCLLAVWDGVSSGTKDMISKGEEYDLQVDVYRTDSRTLDEFF